MKMIKVSHKLDFGVKIKFYSFVEFKKIEFDDKVTFIKLCISVDVIEGNVERFDMERWMRFVTSDEKSIFEINVG